MTSLFCSVWPFWWAFPMGHSDGPFCWTIPFGHMNKMSKHSPTSHWSDEPMSTPLNLKLTLGHLFDHSFRYKCPFPQSRGHHRLYPSLPCWCTRCTCHRTSWVLVVPLSGRLLLKSHPTDSFSCWPICFDGLSSNSCCLSFCSGCWQEGQHLYHPVVA